MLRTSHHIPNLHVGGGLGLLCYDCYTLSTFFGPVQGGGCGSDPADIKPCGGNCAVSMGFYVQISQRLITCGSTPTKYSCPIVMDVSQ